METAVVPLWSGENKLERTSQFQVFVDNIRQVKLFSREFVDGGFFRFFLVGVVTGNPSGCFPKTLPDVYNFVGNQEVSWENHFWL